MLWCTSSAPLTEAGRTLFSHLCCTAIPSFTEVKRHWSCYANHKISHTCRVPNDRLSFGWPVTATESGRGAGSPGDWLAKRIWEPYSSQVPDRPLALPGRDRAEPEPPSTHSLSLAVGIYLVFGTAAVCHSDRAYPRSCVTLQCHIRCFRIPRSNRCP